MKLSVPIPDLKKVLARGNEAESHIKLLNTHKFISYNPDKSRNVFLYMDAYGDGHLETSAGTFLLKTANTLDIWLKPSNVECRLPLSMYNNKISGIDQLVKSTHSTGYSYDNNAIGWNSDIDLPVCKSATFGERSLGFVPVLSVYRDGTPFSIPAGAEPVPIQFNATEYDELSGWDSNLYEYTIQKSGKYWLNFGMTAENIASQNNQMALNLYVNDTPIGGGTVTLNNNEIKSFCKSRFIEFNQGDIIYLGVIVAYDNVDLQDRPYNTYFQMAYLGL